MTDDPRGLADGEGTEPPALSPEEEAAVRDLLAGLPDPQLPADVERRIVTAVGAAAPAGTADADLDGPGTAVGPSGGAASNGSGIAIGASAARHQAPRPGGWRRPWLLQSAAVLVIVGLVGAVAVGWGLGGGNDGGGSAQPAQLVLSQASPGPVTTSGTGYTSAQLATQVRDLVISSTAAPAPEANAGSAGDDDASSTAQTLPGTGDAAALAQVTALVEQQTSRQACIDQLASVPGAQAVAVDVGSFDGKPAAVIVLPDEEDPTKVAAWVVGPTCSSADNPFPYRYERVTRP